MVMYMNIFCYGVDVGIYCYINIIFIVVINKNRFCNLKIKVGGEFILLSGYFGRSG